MRVSERVLKHVWIVLAVLVLPIVTPHALDVALSQSMDSAIAVDGAIQASAVLEADPGGPMYTERPAQTIRASAGDTVTTLAAEFHTDASALRWANGITGEGQPTAGHALLIPPGPGALVELRRPARPSELAAQIGLDPRVILDYNVLSSDDVLPAGRWLQVPKVVAPRSALSSSVVVPNGQGQPSVPKETGQWRTDTFPYGQCTYYVAKKRDVTWGGDAWMWFAAARAFGRPEGQVPVAGAIMVSWESWVGHVAYVERVNTDGSFLVSEMNVRGWGQVDERWISPGTVNIIGFIY